MFADVYRTVPTHRGWVRKLKYAPGRGNTKLLVLYNDGADVWDTKEVSSPGGDARVNGHLKGLAQAKIIKKSVILFWLLNMTI